MRMAPQPYASSSTTGACRLWRSPMGYPGPKATHIAARCKSTHTVIFRYQVRFADCCQNCCQIAILGLFTLAAFGLKSLF